MAGSLSHVVDDDGNFRGTSFVDENRGDTFEALEDCYRIIYFLTRYNPAMLHAACEFARSPTPPMLSGRARIEDRFNDDVTEYDMELKPVRLTKADLVRAERHDVLGDMVAFEDYLAAQLAERPAPSFADLHEDLAHEKKLRHQAEQACDVSLAIQEKAQRERDEARAELVRAERDSDTQAIRAFNEVTAERDEAREKAHWWRHRHMADVTDPVANDDARARPAGRFPWETDDD